MEEPSFWENPTTAQKTISELKPLNGLLKPFEELLKASEDLQAFGELCAEDESLEGDWQNELDRVGKLYEAFELQAMMSGKHDASNAILHIQAGAGGTDACDWAQILLRMYTRWAERHGLEVELQDQVENIEAGIQSCTLRVAGEFAYGYLQSELGVHRLVRISPFGSGDTRQTSFAAVDVLPEIRHSAPVGRAGSTRTRRNRVYAGSISPRGLRQKAEPSAVRSRMPITR
jgi:peptide chain release factor 2